MKPVTVIRGAMLATFLVASTSVLPAHAAEYQDFNNINLVAAEQMNTSMGDVSIKALEKEYKVIVDTVIMRSGPGTSYANKGTLYKGDIVHVKSISNGWAKFEVRNELRYVPESAIERKK